MVDTHSKALKINLDPRWYGTFAEIGAGQEVVRWFFRVGGGAGTIAKSIRLTTQGERRHLWPRGALCVARAPAGDARSGVRAGRGAARAV
jgi:hypothetical protein